MGTKNDPGKFDCYANAEPDEPMFILLGRDVDAPRFVEAWADARELRGEDPAKVKEARECARKMSKFYVERSKRKAEVKLAKPVASAEINVEAETPPDAAHPRGLACE